VSVHINVHSDTECSVVPLHHSTAAFHFKMRNDSVLITHILLAIIQVIGMSAPCEVGMKGEASESLNACNMSLMIQT
jgi:hypothetical protein